MPAGGDHTRLSYDRVAAEYAARLNDELTHKPLERALLDAYATRASGPVCDLGCGPGQVGAYLRSRGARVVGVDLSHGMAQQARRLHPDLPVAQADMRALPFAAGAGRPPAHYTPGAPRTELAEAPRTATDAERIQPL